MRTPQALHTIFPRILFAFLERVERSQKGNQRVLKKSLLFIGHNSQRITSVLKIKCLNFDKVKKEVLEHAKQVSDALDRAA